MNTFKELCEKFDASVLQQLYKKVTDDKGKISDKSVFPIALVQSVFDAISGMRLDDILSHYNYIHLQYKGSQSDTRLAVPLAHRRKTLIVSYTDYDNNHIVEQYVGDTINDNDWQDSNNWKTPFTEGNFIVHVTKDELKQVIDMDEVNRLIQEAIDGLDLGDVINNKVDNAISIYLEDKNDDIINIINNYLNEYLTEEQLSELISLAIEKNINNAIANYFNTDEGKTVIEEVTKPYIDELFEVFKEEITEYLQDNERVIANALIRHEQWIQEHSN